MVWEQQTIAVIRPMTGQAALKTMILVDPHLPNGAFVRHLKGV